MNHEEPILPEQRTTAKERSDLERLTRDREKVAKSHATHYAAELKASVERQLSALYAEDDDAWKEIVAESKVAIRRHQAEVNEVVADICRRRGRNPETHPSLFIGMAWLERGRTAEKERRAELRRTAYANIEANLRRMNVAIEEHSVAMRTQILSSGLRSAEAQALLASMPKPQDLMPAIDLGELERGMPLGLPEPDDEMERWRRRYPPTDPHEA